MARFYGYFAAAYGTFWLCLFVAAVVTQRRIDAGPFGFFGFSNPRVLLRLVPDSARSGCGC
jgi:hypothetical protein